jgi:hypothetical protein
LEVLQYVYGIIQWITSGEIVEEVSQWAWQTLGGSGGGSGGGLYSTTSGTGSGGGENLLFRRGIRNNNLQFSLTLPELEVVPLISGSVVVKDLIPESHETSSSNKHYRRSHMNTQPLPPAFKYPTDYPTNWMVYHSILGVVKKTEADQYDRNHTDDATEEEKEDATRGEENTVSRSGEEKKDEPGEVDKSNLDEEKTIHHSNVSKR